jgi:hypothetical protein
VACCVLREQDQVVSHARLMKLHAPVLHQLRQRTLNPDTLRGRSLPMRVTKHEGPDGVQDGYILDIVRDGRSISQIGVLFDGEVSRLSADPSGSHMWYKHHGARSGRMASCSAASCLMRVWVVTSRSSVRQLAACGLCPQVTEKHEWVGRGADGFPTLEGKVSEIKGKHLTIRCAPDDFLSRSWGRRQVNPENSTSVHCHLRLSGRRLRLSCSLLTYHLPVHDFVLPPCAVLQEAGR